VATPWQQSWTACSCWQTAGCLRTRRAPPRSRRALRPGRRARAPPRLHRRAVMRWADDTTPGTRTAAGRLYHRARSSCRLQAVYAALRPRDSRGPGARSILIGQTTSLPHAAAFPGHRNA
jgi:hypothetical protein